jgi:hypothetical protein
MDVVRDFRTGVESVSVPDFRTDFGSESPYWFLFRFRLFCDNFPRRMAFVLFLARASFVAALACSMVSILRQSCVGGLYLPPRG